MPDVEIVVPVYNEAAGLDRSIRRLHRFLTDGFPFRWRITIADNASVDATPEIARRLAATLPSVQHLRLEQKGRGRALRMAWSRSPARVVAYMDVDLSTDLRGLMPLVAPLLSGHSDLAIGSRLAHGSRVVRGPKREFISRSYNRILRTVLRAKFTDAQCGFKAARRDVLDGTDGRRSRQRLVLRHGDAGARPAAGAAHPRGAGGLGRRPRLAGQHRADGDDRPEGRRAAARRGAVARFMAVGLASTLAYALLYVLMHPALGAVAANIIALAVTAVANTAANRRFTFRVRGREELVSHHVRGAVVFVLTVMLTTGALAVLHGLDATPARWVELVVLVAASLTATITRYVALRTWVFTRKRRTLHTVAAIER